MIDDGDQNVDGRSSIKLDLSNNSKQNYNKL